MISPVLTVVTVTLQAANELQKTMESLAAIESDQSVLEHVVVNGGEDKETRHVLQRYQSAASYPVVVVSEPDEGIYDAMNKGLRHASGQYVQFLNAGDWIVHGTIISEFAALVASAEPDVVMARTLIRYRDGSTAISQNIPYIRWKHFLGLQMHAHPSTFIHRRLMRELGGFSTDFGIAGDFELVLRATAHARPLCWDRVVVEFVADGVSWRRRQEIPNLLSGVRRSLNPAWGHTLEPIYSRVYARRYAHHLKAGE